MWRVILVCMFVAFAGCKAKNTNKRPAESKANGKTAPSAPKAKGKASPPAPEPSAPPDPLAIMDTPPVLLLPNTAAQSNIPVGASVVVTVAKNEITVDHQTVLKVSCERDGKACKVPEDLSKADSKYFIDRIHKEHMKQEALEIVPLRRALEKITKRLKSDPDRARLSGEARRQAELAASVLTIVVDSDIPYRMIAEVVYTAGMAEFSDMRFVVRPAADKSKVAVQRVSAPRESTESPEKEDEEEDKTRKPAAKKAASSKPLNLTVMIRRKGNLRVYWDEDVGLRPFFGPVTMPAAYCGTATSLATCTKSADGKSCGCYDLAKLYKHLVKLKARFPKEKRINVSATLEVPWKVISAVIDTVTCKRAGAVTDLASFQKSKPVLGKSQKIPGVPKPVPMCEPLFQRVVFTMVEDAY